MLQTIQSIRIKTLFRIVLIPLSISIYVTISIHNQIPSPSTYHQAAYSIDDEPPHDDSIQDESNPNAWKAESPWDAPPVGFYNENATGSLQNCTAVDELSAVDNAGDTNNDTHFYSGTIQVSCHAIRYKAPAHQIHNAGPIIIGVLSAASSSGPKRRNYIRSTWASHTYTNSTFFLVAGPWSAIQDEFEFYKDMIWIDEEEIYQGEKSVLTFKTTSYFAIVHLLGKRVEDGGWRHAFKTDDDSYVNVGRIMEKFIENDGKYRDLHYYGQCPQFQVLPSRDVQNKWPVTFQTYPEPKFPLYCQGAGFGLSRELVQTAVEQQHIANFRYMPFEDVSIGILAERCGKQYHATMVSGIKVFRADTPKERDCVNRAIPMTECFEGDGEWPPDARIGHSLIQHRVDDREDMVGIHKSLGLDVHWVDVTANEIDMKSSR